MDELLKKIGIAGGLLKIVDGNLKLYSDGNQIDPEILNAIRVNKNEITEYLIKNDIGGIYKSEYENIPTIPLAESYAISNAQRRLWVLSQIEEGSASNNIPGNAYLDEEINIEYFKKAIDAVIERHEILRTVFKEDAAGEIRQWILEPKDLGFKIDYKDFRKDKNKEEKVKDYISEDTFKAFDLERGPLLRAGLLHIENEKYVFYYNMHHIISDGWSMDIMCRDVLAYYQGYKENKLPGLKELRIQYKDYSAWQLAQLEEESFQSHRNYWLNSLSGELPLLDLPSTKQRPVIKTNKGYALRAYINPATTNKLKKYSESNGGSLFMGLLAVWNILMYRYTSQKDIIIGTPIAGREHSDLEDQIGFYLNTLALRNEINPEESFNEFFKKLKDNTLASYAHQIYPFDRLVEELDLQRDTSRSAVFDMIIGLQNTGEQTEGDIIKAEDFDLITDFGYTASRFDLEFTLQEVEDYISFELLYNPDVYDFEMAEGLILHYRQLLQALLENPEEKFSRVDYLSVEEKYKLQVTFNETSNVYPKDKTFVDLFAEQVAKTPDHTAIVFGEKELTYKELDERSNQLARYLQTNYKIQTDNLVGIMFERNEWMMVSILAVWKSGGAYVPMDADHPVERINQIITSSNLCVLITEGEEKDGLNVPVIDLKKEKSKFLSLSVDALNTRINPDSLAYVIYTSGSTGLPKGVMIEHLGMLNHIISKIDEMGIDAEGKVAQNAPHTFDISVWQFFSALMVGGTTVIYNRDTILDPSLFIKMVDADKITTLELVPSYLLEMLTSLELPSSQQILFSDLKILILNAETLTPSMVKRWFARYPHIPIVNTYGATEASDDISHYIMYECPSTVTIPVLKRPIQNFQVHIVDENMQLVPVGVKGEILLSGPAVGRGYLNNEEQTKKSFLHGPMPGITDHKRIYRTGDLGCYLPDGTMEFLGRKDNQVKVNGHRVELGEVEYVLNSHPDVKQAVVLLRNKDQLSCCLVYDPKLQKEDPDFKIDGLENNIDYLYKENPAESQATKNAALFNHFLESDKAIIDKLKDFLKQQLPHYMIPSYYLMMEELPLTKNGKIDRLRLSRMDFQTSNQNIEYVAPGNELEENLVKIWQEILQRENIGIKDDFFALGGHSLKAVRLSNEYEKKLAVKLSLKDLFAHTTIESHAELIINSKKSEFIQIKKSAQKTSYPVSHAQRRLWVLSQFEGGSVAYNMPSSIRLSGNYDIESFKKAIDSTIERHEILRTVFKEDEVGNLMQWIIKREDLGFEIDFIDYRNEKDKQEKVQAYIQEDSYKVFDLENGALLRASLLRVENDEYVFYYNMHHIISDGWSTNVLSKDVLAYYEAYKKNEQPKLKELRIQYKDYAAWAIAQLEEESYKSHKAYWLKSLEGELPLLDLPSTKQRPRIKTHNGHGLNTCIGSETTGKLKQYTQENGGSLFMGLLAAWSVLMYRYTSQKDIIIGTPMAGREHADLEDQIGFYVNTLGLRNQVSQEQNFTDFYKKVKETTLAGYAHQAYPFDMLVDELDVQRDTSRSPVFDMSITYHNIVDVTEGNEPDDINQIVTSGSFKVKFDMELHFQEIGNYISFNLIYNEDVYDRELIKVLMNHFKRLLDSLLSFPEKKIGYLHYLSEKEEHELLVTFNDTKVDYPKDKTIVDLFEEQVVKTPDNIAVVFEEKELTYRELDEKSNQLANHLRKNYSIDTEDIVGIQLQRSEWLIISILGILKAGGAYVPIDPEYPSSRKEHIIKDTSLKLLITETNFIHDIDYFEGNIFAIDVEFDSEKYSSKKLSKSITSKNLAYVIYTSGSTGYPKGVMIEHHAIVNTLLSQIEFLQINNKNKGLQFASFSFDASVWETFIILLSGASLCIVNEKDRKDPKLLTAFINANEIDIATLPPSYLYKINPNELKLKKLITAGESAVFKKAIEHLEFRAYYNAYGPTETSICCTIFKLENKDSLIFNSLPIGKPINNTQIYILNGEEQLQPIGVIGEICVGGDGLARGYLNQEVLTKEKFIKNPFQEGDRLYKTGDLGRWLPDGNIEFISRKDDQVKIRGYRIELGEIEQTLLKNEQIEEVVVIAKENAEGEKELVAYITAKSEQNTSELRSYLKEILPEYMLPTYYVQLEVLPLTSNGKIDKKLLPDPGGLGLTSGVEYIAPRNEVEEKLVKIWEEVLQRENIGVKDDFFELGGHSLKAIRLSNEYGKILSVKISLKDLFENTTIETHATLIQSSKNETFIQIEQATPQKNYPISNAQRRLWVLSRFEEGLAAYNISNSLYLNQDIDIDSFKRAIFSTIDRHEILRTVFKEDESGEVRQWVLSKEDLGFEIAYKDFRKEENKEEKVNGYLSEDANKAFDLEQGPLLRAAILHIEEGSYVFHYNMHHIISDGWSMDVLSKDVFSYYEAYKENKEPSLKALRIQYKDYSSWQLAQLEEESFKAHRDYWLKSLEGELPLIDLPSSKVRPKVRTNNGHSILAYIDSSQTKKLRKYAQDNGGSLYMGLLASWNVLIHRYTSQRDIIIASSVAGREHSDLEDQIGFYTNTLAIRNTIKTDDSFDSFFSRVRQNTLNAYSHQVYPFDRLVEELDLPRDTSRSAVFDVMLFLQNNGAKQEAPALSEEEANSIEEQAHGTSKFDLNIAVLELGDYLGLQVVYNPDVYESDMVRGLIKHYKQLLSSLLENPGEKISQIDYLSEEEKQELLFGFNDGKVDYPRDKTIVDIFEAQVKKTPDTIAVVFNGKTLSYKELDTLSNQLASCLQKKYSIQSEDLVGIQLERSEWMIVSILGVLKAGGAYVPIDPEDPSSRKDHIIKDASLKLLITEVNFIHDIDYYEGEIFAIDVEFDAASYSTEYTKADLHPDQLAYVIYTSGSTGNPKGVMISLGSLMDYSFGVMEKTNIRECERFGLVSTIAADLGNTVVYTSLLIGGSLHIISKEDLLDVNKLQNSNLDCLKLTPSHWKALQNDDLFYVPNKCLILGGEEFSEEILNRIKINEAVCEVYNHYGPTETTIGKLIQRIDKNQSTFEISLGTPMGNNQVYVLDSSQELCPVGVSGEICISGAGLARGYLNQEALTKEKFIANPFKAGERLYRTGDLGKRTKAGQIKFIGRKDDQVKIRGYRVELGEVEQGLLTNKEIKQAVVLARENQQKVKELVAYIVAESDQNSNTLRTYLKEILPEYMLPSYYVQLKALPLTSNGKIDKKSLPNPEGMGLTSGLEYVGPKNELEEKLVELWQTVLKRENIGIKDDFFSLGGHSLKALRLSNEYQKELSVMIPLKELFTHTTIESHAALISSSKRSAFIQIEKIAHQESYAISDAQRRLWVLAQFEGGSAAYNSPKIIYLNQEIETENFKKAIAATIDRHEILRTVFKEDASGEIRQWILEPKDLGFEIKYEDFRKEKNKEEKVKNYIAEDSYKAFDLERGPLLRASLLQIEDESYVFYYNMHHIISDGWSVDVLSKDVLSYYQAFKDNVLPSLEELRIQYKDYSAWQLAQLESESFASHRAYWLNSLGGELPLLDLPSTKKRPRIKTNNGHGLSTYIDKATTAKLKKYSQENGGSLFMGLLAVWNILMYRYTSQKDIIIGTPIAGREHADLEDQIGFYLNTLTLRNHVDSKQSFLSFYNEVKESTLSGYTHQAYPFDRLVEELNLSRDMGRSPLFDVLLDFHNTGDKNEKIELNENEINSILDLGNYVVKYDLELHFTEAGDYISIEVNFNEDVYDKDIIEGVIDHYKNLIVLLINNSNESINTIDFLSNEEKNQLIVGFNDTGVVYPKEKTIIDLFEEQVKKTPDNVAIKDEKKSLTYKELDELSNQLAHCLVSRHSVKSDDLVGIKLDKGEWAVISMLGILKIGAAYVPIDPDYPTSRKQHILSESKIELLITSTNYIFDEEEFNGSILAVDVEFEKDLYSKERINQIKSSKSLAYVIYTSGSTGNPKGVMIDHMSLTNYLIWALSKYSNDSGSLDFGLFTSLSFDLTLTSLYLPLISGGELRIFGSTSDVSTVLKSYFESGIKCIKLTPAHIDLLSNLELEGTSVQLAIVGGDKLENSQVKILRKLNPSIQIYNEYGPTESTVGCTVSEILSDKGDISIGKPISNTQIYILSEEKGLQPVGVPGEICISGSGLARGYLNQEALTREKFIANPFKAGDRLYKTGDLGRWLPDGNIEFIGRKDDQVKIRGYRIELGEIEHALLKNEAIEEAVVLAKTNDNNEKELVAYLVSKEEQNTSELRSYLKGILPEYMLPVYFVQLEAMPLTSNGKIDKKNLPDPEGLGLASGVEYVAPRNEIEEKLVKIWEEILQRENIGVKDDFFALGGHSLKAVRLAFKVQSEYHIKIGLDKIFEHTTIEKFAEFISIISMNYSSADSEMEDFKI